jgi:putative redox protein
MVTATLAGEKYKTEVTVTGHSVIVDEPLEVGGGNLGPAPGQFLQLSLASCTAITVRMYADRKGWQLDKVVVEVDTEKVEGKTIVKREVDLVGNLDADQRKRLLQIANACPIHKVLTNPIEIETVLR